MKKVKSILKGAVPADGEHSVAPEIQQSPAASASKPITQLVSTVDLTIDQVRSTLQLINKMLRKQAQPAELAALLKIKEMREILELHKVNPKESSERIGSYQKELAARLRAHDRGKRPADESVSPEDSSASKRARSEAERQPEQAAVKPKPQRQRLTGILSQAELAVAPLSAPISSEFNVEWIQYFFQLMCSRIPFFSDKNLLVNGPARTYVEESEEQRIFVDGLSGSEIVLLLNFVFDLESHLKTSDAKDSIIIPTKAAFIGSMGDPLESGLLEARYFNHQAQCATCALRFANRKLLTIHHDYHYHKYTIMQRRKKGLDNNFRGWMESPQEFIGSKEVQFGFHMYDSLSQLISGSAFLKSVGFVSASPGMDVSVDSGKKLVAASHEARTQTLTQVLAEQVLPTAAPVDEIKSRCLECGESFEKIWIAEPIDMAVFVDTVAVSVGGSVPLQFAWPIAAKSTAQDLDEDELDADQVRREQHKVQARKALSDNRFVNALMFHKSCFHNNARLKEREAQMALLVESTQQTTDLIAQLRPPPESVEPAVIEEYLDDDEDLTMA